MHKKTCTKCKTEYPATTEYFHQSKYCKDGLVSCCKQCRAEYHHRYYMRNSKKLAQKSSQYRQQNSIKVNENQRKWRYNNPDKIRKYNRRQKLKRDYNMIDEQYDQMLKQQNGVCAICKKLESGKSKNGKIQPLSVDHDHVTGKIRGLLCHTCNPSLGNMKDNPGLLKLAAVYLEKHHPKIVRVYCSHYVRGPKGLKATDGDMRTNCYRAVVHSLELEAQFPNVDFYVPGMTDEPIAIAYKRGYLDERQILKIDCEIIDTCRAILLFVWGDYYLSRGMQIEVDHAKAHSIPIFRTDKLEGFKNFVERICRESS